MGQPRHYKDQPILPYWAHGQEGQLSETCPRWHLWHWRSYKAPLPGTRKSVQTLTILSALHRSGLYRRVAYVRSCHSVSSAAHSPLPNNSETPANGACWQKSVTQVTSLTEWYWISSSLVLPSSVVGRGGPAGRSPSGRITRSKHTCPLSPLTLSLLSFPCISLLFLPLAHEGALVEETFALRNLPGELFRLRNHCGCTRRGHGVCQEGLQDKSC